MKTNTTLNVYYLITKLTRAYKFAAKLSKHEIYNGKISVEFTLQNRRVLRYHLKLEVPSTYSLGQCNIDDLYDEQPEILTKEVLEIKSDELAIKRAINIIKNMAVTWIYRKELQHMQKIQYERGMNSF